MSSTWGLRFAIGFSASICPALSAARGADGLCLEARCALGPAEAGKDAQLARALRLLRRDPTHAAARRRLDALIQEDGELFERELLPVAAPLTLEERQAAREDSQGWLRGGESREAAPGFSQGLREYAAGRLLNAWRLLARFLETGLGAAWSIEEARSLVERGIPAALKAKLRFKPRELRTPYRAGWEALRRGRLDAARRSWREYAERLGGVPYPQRELADLEEIRAIESTLPATRSEAR